MVSAVAWWGYGITSAIMVLLLVGMVAVIRAMSDTSGRYQEVKDMMDAMFHTPSFLRPESGASGTDNRRNETAAAITAYEPFEDECPGCRHKVTHEDAECPSCGLRLLN